MFFTFLCFISTWSHESSHLLLVLLCSTSLLILKKILLFCIIYSFIYFPTLVTAFRFPIFLLKSIIFIIFSIIKDSFFLWFSFFEIYDFFHYYWLPQVVCFLYVIRNLVLIYCALSFYHTSFTHISQYFLLFLAVPLFQAICFNAFSYYPFSDFCDKYWSKIWRNWKNCIKIFMSVKCNKL